MKGIGIITYHHYNNYGTMLQALALEIALGKMGYETELIDFININRAKGIDLLKIRIKRLPVYIRDRSKYLIMKRSKTEVCVRNNIFEKFYQQNLKVSRNKYTSSQELLNNPPEYDAYIVGSDQTWNPNAGNNPEAFFLTFAPKEKLRGSYAPSIAVKSFTEEQKKRFVKLLSNIEYLSCREQTGSELIYKLTGRISATVVDPTLLLNRYDWEKYESNYGSDEKYILQYFLGDVKEHRKFVKILAKKLRCKIISLPFSYLDLEDEICDKRFVGPSEFLNLIHHAEVVCTDSFHGTLFSINYHKPFFSFCKSSESNCHSENSRLTDMLEKFGLMDRLVIDDFEQRTEDVNLEINYEKIDKIINVHINESKEYLKNMLGQGE